MPNGFLEAFLSGRQRAQRAREFETEQERLRSAELAQRSYQQQQLQAQAGRDYAENLYRQQQLNLQEQDRKRQQRRDEITDILAAAGLISRGEAVPVEPSMGTISSFGPSGEATQLPVQTSELPAGAYEFGGRKLLPTTPLQRAEQAANLEREMKSKDFMQQFDLRNQVAQKYLHGYRPEEINEFALTGKLPDVGSIGELAAKMLQEGRRAGRDDKEIWNDILKFTTLGITARASVGSPSFNLNRSAEAITDDVWREAMTQFQQLKGKAAETPADYDEVANAATAAIDDVLTDPAARSIARRKIEQLRRPTGRVEDPVTKLIRESLEKRKAQQKK